MNQLYVRNIDLCRLRWVSFFFCLVALISFIARNVEIIAASSVSCKNLYLFLFLYSHINANTHSPSLSFPIPLFPFLYLFSSRVGQSQCIRIKQSYKHEKNSYNCLTDPTNVLTQYTLSLSPSPTCTSSRIFKHVLHSHTLSLFCSFTFKCRKIINKNSCCRKKCPS